MLKGIGECNQSALVAFYTAEFLGDVSLAPGVFFEAVDCLNEFVSVLFVADVVEIGADALAEGEVAWCYVFVVVVVYC